MAHKTTINLNGVLTEVTEFDSSAQEIDDAVDAIPVLQVAIAAVIPSGLISMWSGAASNIPDGWLLCDGSNGTPDLRGRFIVGAGGDYAVGATGGSNTVALSAEEMPSHTHKFTGQEHTHGGTINMTGLTCSEAGGHTHKIDRLYDRYGNEMYIVETKKADGNFNDVPILSQYSGECYYTNSDATEGTHTHNISGKGSVSIDPAVAGGVNENAGGGKAHENRPPYYALCYIMKK